MSGYTLRAQNGSNCLPLQTLLKKEYTSLTSKDIACLDEYYKLAKSSNHTGLTNKIGLYKANYLAKNKQYDKSVLLLLPILENAQDLSFSDSVAIITALRQNYVALNNLPRAYEFQEILEKLITQAPQKFNYLYIPRRSGLFNAFSMHKRAIYWHQQEIKTVPDTVKDNYFLASYYNNLGVYWNKVENADSSLLYFYKSRTYAEHIEPSYGKNLRIFFKGLIDGNIGQALMLKHKFAEAVPFLKKDIAASYWYNQKDNAAISQAELAQCYFQLGDLNAAENELQKAFVFITLQNNPTQYIKSLRLHSEILEKQNRTKEYIVSLKTIQKLIDSLEYSKQVKEKNNQRVVLQLQLYRQQLQSSLNQIEIEKASNNRQSIIKVYILFFSVALLLIIVALIYQYRNSNQQRLALTEQNKKIIEQNKIIEESLHEKTLLIKEIHHRVKNNLQMVSSLLNLQSGMITDENAKVVLEEARHRIGSLAIVHQQLYGKSDFSFIKIDEYIVHLMKHLKSAYHNTNKDIQTIINCEPLELHIDTAIPLGIIINEIITNAHKHAFNGRDKGSIVLDFKKEDAFFILTITDDGVGLPFDFEEQKKYSLGQELIDLLSEQINAALKISSEPNHGTTYCIKWKA